MLALREMSDAQLLRRYRRLEAMARGDDTMRPESGQADSVRGRLQDVLDEASDRGLVEETHLGLPGCRS